MIGTILGNRYEIIEEIGNGGMAHVYKARCTLLNRIVAVKILRDDLEGETEFLKRFNVEAQAAASLTHSNIVSIFDVGYDNGRHYIIMEYVDGITLKEYISEKQHLEYKEALSIAYQISGALQAAHQKNIVHRDIKPHNILVTEDGRIKVTDFGIARSSTHKTISSNGDIIGSVHYISPEQAKGETVDTRSDIYSLGIVIHEMITGKVPFDGDSPVAVAMMQIESRANNRILEEFDVPLSVQQIIFKAMAKEPELRYQDADELKSDILNVLHDVNYKIADGDLYMDFEDEQIDGNAVTYKEIKAVKKPLVKAMIIILAFVTSFAVVLFSTYVYVNGVPGLLSLGFGKKTVEVPDLSGLTLIEAKEKCTGLDLKVVISEEINNEDYEAEVIVSQEPKSHSRIDKGSSVEVVINKGVEMAVLDDYTGLNYEAVQEELEDIGYTVIVVFEESKKHSDTILRQSPQSGKELKKDSVITLYVSSGMNSTNKYITVPNLVGKTYSQSESSLTSLGLTIELLSSAQVDKDAIVESQAIPAGSLVKKGSAVIVTLEEESNNSDTDIESNESENNESKHEESDEKNNTGSRGRESTSVSPIGARRVESSRKSDKTDNSVKSVDNETKTNGEDN